MTESFPGVTSTIRAIAIGATALFVAATCGGYIAGKRSVDTSMLEAQVKKAKDSVKALERDRALYVGQAAALRVAAEIAKKERAVAVAHADSLTTAAERHRTFRLRIVDSTHIAVTSSDTARVAEIATVPIDVVIQLQLDSAALEAHDISEGKLLRENNTLQLENLKLWQAVAADSAELRQKDDIIDGLTKMKSPSRCGAKCGAALTVGALTVLEIARRALAALLHP